MASRACKKIFAALSEYLDGNLPAHNCHELERHLAGCEPCLAYLETLRTTAAACRRYSEMKSLVPPKEFVSKLRARLMAFASPTKLRRRRSARH